MITSLQLINEYCSRLQLPTPTMIHGDLYTCNDDYLCIMDKKDATDYYDVVGKDFEYASKVKRIVTILLKCDVGLSDKLLKKGSELAIVHIQKEPKLNEFRTKSVNGFLIFFRNAFGYELGTNSLENTNIQTVIKKAALTKYKIYYKELAKQLFAMLEELKKNNIKCKIEASELTYRDSKYIFTWLK